MNDAFCQYLKDHEFSQFMRLWKKQYEKYGTCKGSIDLWLDDKNRNCIEGLLGKDYYDKDKVHITYKQLVKAISNTRFCDCDFNEVLCLYFNQNIQTKKEKKEQKKKTIDSFFFELFKTKGHSSDWIYSVYQSKDSVYTRLVQECNKGYDLALKQTKAVMDVLNDLPMWKNEKENISIFSSKHTKNPHAFDKNTFLYYLLLHGITYFLNKEYPTTNLDQNECLYQAGLYQDGISNYCIVARLLACDKDKKVHEGWLGFYRSFEALNTNMDNLLQVQSIFGVKRIYIVENPSVFQALLKKIKKQCIKNIGLVCTNGQLNYSAYRLLDLIESANIKTYYSGDMDPEGLCIADKIQQKYPHIQLWCYDKAMYQKCKSFKRANLQRMHMLQNIKSTQLMDVIHCIQENQGCVGYQENMIDVYLESLENE